MRKFLAALVSVAVMAGGALVFAPAASAAKKPVVVWAAQEFRPALLAMFAQGINGRKVKVEAVDTSTITTQLRDANPASAPDLVFVENSITAELASAALIEPLTLPAQTRTALSGPALDGWKFGFTYYGVPVIRQNVALITNADLVPTAPTTFNRLSKLALALRDEGRISVPFAVAQGETGNAETTYPLYSGLGGFVFGTNAAGSLDPTKVGINNKKFRKYSGRIDQWNASGLINSSLTADAARDAFVNGQSPFWITSPDSISTLRTLNFRYRITAVPRIVKSIPAAPLMKSWGIAVTPFARQHGVLPAAIALATQIAPSKDAQTAFYGKTPIPALPANTAAAAAVPDRVLLAFGAAASGAVPYPNIPQWAAASTALGGAWRDSTKGAEAVPAAQSFAAARQQVAALSAG